jgi:hypothetical protein
MEQLMCGFTKLIGGNTGQMHPRRLEGDAGNNFELPLFKMLNNTFPA